MKTLLLGLALALIALPVVAGDQPSHQSASGWFDMENCAFCKNLVEDPGLLSHMTWESHEISNGAVTIATVDPAYRASYEKAGKAMETLGNKMMNGEVNPMTVKMCGHCQMFGQLMMAGARMEEVHGDLADVSLITSDNPDVVKMIHQMTERDRKEMAMMEGRGHDHPDDHGAHKH
ncbi:MAG: hypothetical protein R3D98_15450 [Candidatus Krumholzibacteriia bacterium]